MNKVLIKKFQDNFDGHGEPETYIKGFEIMDNKDGSFKDGSGYDMEYGKIIFDKDPDEEDEELYAQDGYHCTKDFCVVKVIKTEEELKEVELLVELYKKYTNE
jgi:hypothetical protein